MKSCDNSIGAAIVVYWRKPSRNNGAPGTTFHSICKNAGDTICTGKCLYKVEPLPYQCFSCGARLANSSASAFVSGFSQRGQSFKSSLSISVLDDDVFPFDVTQLLQTLAKCLDYFFRRRRRGETGCHIPDTRDFLRLLRFGGKAKKEE